MDYQYKQEVTIQVKNSSLVGELTIPFNSNALVIFSHGSGSGRNSPRNQKIAQYLHQKRFATLLMDLLTEEEDTIYQNRFDITLLSNRLIEVTKWVQVNSLTRNFKIGYFGASTGVSSAIKAAVVLADDIKAIVSRGGRPDLAMDVLEKLVTPTLIIVGSLDTDVLALNKKSFENMHCIKKMKIIQGASHLFEEPGKLELVAALSTSWFEQYLNK